MSATQNLCFFYFASTEEKLLKGQIKFQSGFERRCCPRACTINHFMAVTNSIVLYCNFLPIFVPLFFYICDQCYKTFYGRKLRLFIISYKVVPCKHFHPSLIFVCKARAYPNEAPSRCSPLG
jgi:hypothetical protein